MRLLSVELLPDRVQNWELYPFLVPAIQSLKKLEVRAPVCFFVGENGSGKSTLMEAIAVHYGFGHEGGNRNFSAHTTMSLRAIDPLAKALRVAFNSRSGYGFYLRAESFFNIATRLEDLGGDYAAYGGVSLHELSHGESFLALFENRFRRSGLYILDEPEAALSPQRQLSFLAILHNLLKEKIESQFLIATHSPILLSYPGAQIFGFDGGRILETIYEDTAPYQIMKGFMNNPERSIKELLR